jgi:hypothetical protein
MIQTNHHFSHDPVALASAPALAASIRRTHCRQELATPARTLLRHNPPVQLYRIAPQRDEIEAEAHAAAQMLIAVADRLRRLRDAYAAWRQFDAGAYFDLSDAQAARLVHVEERVTMVHVVFWTDVLLPSFQRAEAFWQEDFRPHYLDLRAHLRQGNTPLAPVMVFADRSQPQMIEHWQRLVAVIRATRGLLGDDIRFWSANGAEDERARWRWAWEGEPAPGLAAELLPAATQPPTLTLSIDFPLPAYRQPGRRRRLALQRARGDMRPQSG